MKEVDCLSVAEIALQRIQKGAFLTVKATEEVNTMTIGWATIGFLWNKPIMMVAVRDSRHTYSLMEKSNDYTVSIPSTDMHDTVMFCGTKSGRDVNKFQACRLETSNARTVASPIIQIPGLHLECRIVYKTPMDATQLTPDYESLYPKKDYHTLYFGEILMCYEI